MHYRSYISYLVAVVLTFLLIQVLNEKPIDSKAPRFLAPPPESLEYFTLGFNESIADSLWLRWIQDNDICFTYLGVHSTNLIPAQQGEFANPRHKVCDNSWSFKMLDAITRTAPRFKMPYDTGAITLSVLVEDYDGAKIIFERGLAAYPDDWSLMYRAAYHFLYDLSDYQRAADLMNRAAIHGAPVWLKLLAGKLYSKSGQIELGLSSLQSYRKTVEDKPDALARVDKRIAELQKQLAKQQSGGKGP